MRMTKIYFKSWSRPGAFVFGLCLALFVFLFWRHDDGVKMVKQDSVKVQPAASPAPASDPKKIELAADPVPASPLSEKKVEPKPEPTEDFDLNFIQIGSRITISFQGRMYNTTEFPYPTFMVKNHLYARLPQSLAHELKAAKRLARSMPDKSTSQTVAGL